MAWGPAFYQCCSSGCGAACSGTGGSAGSGSVCGDAVVEPGEACDEGTANNTGAYGGCNANCTLGPYCGDGMLQLQFGESCDDGNGNSGDGCSSSCQVEPGYACATPGYPCQLVP